MKLRATMLMLGLVLMHIIYAGIVTANNQITVTAQVINFYDPVSTVEQPQMSYKIEHQRDLLGKDLTNE